jgi:hypothetical protein
LTSSGVESAPTGAVASENAMMVRSGIGPCGLVAVTGDSPAPLAGVEGEHPPMPPGKRK